MPRRAARVDSNHAQIIAGLRGCGYPCMDTHSLPGALDVLVMSRTGRLCLFEIKDPRKPAPVTDAELATLAMFRGAAFVVKTVEDCIGILNSIDGM